MDKASYDHTNRRFGRIRCKRKDCMANNNRDTQIDDELDRIGSNAGEYCKRDNSDSSTNNRDDEKNFCEVVDDLVENNFSLLIGGERRRG